MIMALHIPVVADFSMSESTDIQDDLIEIGIHDCVTNTDTIQTISISELKRQNTQMIASMKKTEEAVMSGYNPVLEAMITGSESSNDTRSIIGEDDQITPVNVNNFPYRCIVYLRSFFDLNNDGTYDIYLEGTGFLVGPNVMVTAGHNFYCGLTINNSVEYFWVDECRIYPRQASEEISEDTDDYYYPKSWTYSTAFLYDEDTPSNNANNLQHDWIVANLFSPLGSTNGWLSVRDWELSVNGLNAYLSGYPADSDDKLHFQYRTTGVIQQSDAYMLAYNMDAEPGNSGSPVYINGSTVIGIHTLGTGNSFYPGKNCGVRITESLYNIIQNRLLDSLEQYG